MIIVAAVLTALFVYILLFYLENFPGFKRPPGPLRFPPFGTLIQVAIENNVGFIALHKLSKTYGDAMSIKAGFMDAVILSSYDSVKHIFSKNETLDRDCTGLFYDRNLKQNVGLLFSNGSAWTEARSFCRTALRKYGYGNRDSMQNLITAELEELLKSIDQESMSNPQQKIHFNSTYFQKSFLNLMCTWVMGKRFDYDDPLLIKLLGYSHDLVKNGVMGAGIMAAYPFLRHVFPEQLGFNLQMKGATGYHQCGREILRKRKLCNYQQNPACFTDEFVQKMDEEASKPDPFFTEDQFAVIFSDILQAGTDTTANVVNCILLHLVCNQEIQDKVYQEILNVIGPNRSPHIGDKPLMPFTNSVIWEGLRWSRVAVISGLRKATGDFTYGEYLIKKDTIIMVNYHSLFFDEKEWGDPEVFRPERFLDSDGHLDLKKVDRMLVFGTGKRTCFGEVLARDSMFLFVTSLIQKFKFILASEDKPNLEPILGMVLYSPPYDAFVTTRSKIETW